MDDELALGGPEIEPGAQSEVRVLPVQIGGATVFVEQIGEGPVTDYDEGLYPVGPPSPTEAFEKANEALKECVRVVGETLEKIGDRVKPQEVSLEFSLSFQAEGTARIIPVLVTGKTAASTGLKVTATWQLGERKVDG
jgi:Trypsin-co-occurring domain 1